MKRGGKEEEESIGLIKMIKHAIRSTNEALNVGFAHKRVLIKSDDLNGLIQLT